MIEQNILGLVLTGQLDPLITGLEEKHFTNFAFKNLWSEILLTAGNRQAPDVITMSEIMNKNNDGEDWFTNLAVLAKNNIGSFSAAGHIAQLKKEWGFRALKDVGAEILNSDNNDVNYFIKTLMALSTTERKYLHTFVESANDALDEIDKIVAGETLTVPTGLHDIDNVMGGLHNSDLIIVAARPAMGKTAFMLNIAAANKNRPLIFSTEQSRIQAMNRMFSIHGNVPGHKIRTADLGDVEYGQISQAILQIKESDGFIYDKSGPYMSEIEATARQVYNDHGCTAIYLDYLQRIKHENPKLPRHEQVGDVAMRLKELARELNIPVVALAQVSRKCEERTDKRPLMGDIKDSGTIEQEADLILTLYRDEVYNEDTPDKNICEVDFKKNRHGGTGIVKTVWNAPVMRFENLAPMRFS